MMMDGSDDDFYSVAGDSDEYEDDVDDDGVSEADSNDDGRNVRSYTVLTEADIRRIQEERVANISHTLSLSRGDSTVLLLHYGWTESRVHDEWFADEARVRGAVGLIAPPEPEDAPGATLPPLACGICLEYVVDADATRAAACGHRFCDECWRGYIRTSISDGPGCLLLRCPQPSCGAAVGRDMVYGLATGEEKERYDKFLVRSYVEATRTARWCPAPGCEFAVDFRGGAGDNEVVVCGCGYGFCWSCNEEAHRPVDCETVRKWMLKNSSESENTMWMLANSKPCPKCGRSIEKNRGCMHMTCSEPCRFHFCWLCLGPWSDHGARTGGFYSCNNYQKAKKEGLYQESERKRRLAKKSILRYTHYYERWAANDSSGQKARAELVGMGAAEKLDALMGLQSSGDVGFVVEAWRQIVECRRVLKWTYAYGYYIPTHEHGRRRLFEYMQGEAEAGLERLHRCAEIELQQLLLDPKGGDFKDFQEKLAGLTSVTKTYFQNLVQALENGLRDVAGTSNGGGQGDDDDDDDAYWSCESCTFANSWKVEECGACGRHRLLRSES